MSCTSVLFGEMRDRLASDSGVAVAGAVWAGLLLMGLAVSKWSLARDVMVAAPCGLALGANREDAGGAYRLRNAPATVPN